MAGAPSIVGESFRLTTSRSKAGRETGDELPSVTLITIPDVVPTSLFDGVPLNSPVVELNAAQPG